MNKTPITLDPRTITSTNFLVERAHTAALKAGWWRDVDPINNVFVIPAKLGLIHSEISEAMEGHRTDRMDKHLPHRSNFEVELADAVIRIMDLAGRMKLDLGGAISEKMAYNASRADHRIENRNKPGGKKY